MQIVRGIVAFRSEYDVYGLFGIREGVRETALSFVYHGKSMIAVDSAGLELDLFEEELLSLLHVPHVHMAHACGIQV